LTDAEKDITNDSEESKLRSKRVLLDREDWEDPKNRKVLSEYHKEGLTERMATVEAELDTFEKYWKRKPSLESIKIKEVAPVSEPEEIEDEEEGRISRPIDTATLEVILYALFRMVFGRGVDIPIKRPGLVDMDVIVRGKDVIINTNQLYYAMPDLAVWKVSYTHKGKTIAEFGRGIRRGLKINILNAIALFFEVWKMGRQNRKINRSDEDENESRGEFEVGRGE